MKKIIICEGKNDGIFLKKIFQELNIDKSTIKFFCQNEVKLNEKINAETKILRQFMEPHSFNPYKILVKIEGGDKTAIKIFCREMTKFFTYLDESILLLDFDRGNVENKISKIKEIIKVKYSSTPLSLTHNTQEETDHIHHSIVGIYHEKTNQEIGKFRIIFLKESLEILCEINRQETEEEKIKKIEDFIVDNKFSDYFSGLI